MHQTAGTDTGPRWELGAHVASSVFFVAALAGLFLPWDWISRSETQTGLQLLFSKWVVGPTDRVSVLLILATVVTPALGVRTTRGRVG